MTTPETTLDDNLQGLKILSMNPQELEDFLERANVKELEDVIAKILLVTEEINKEIEKVSGELQVLLEKKEQDKGGLDMMSSLLEKAQRKIEKLSAYIMQLFKQKQEKTAAKNLEKKKETLKELLKSAEQVEYAIVYNSAGNNTSDISVLQSLKNKKAVTEDEVDDFTSALKKEINTIKKMKKYHNLFPTDAEVKKVKTDFHDLVKKLSTMLKKDAKYLPQYLFDDVQNILTKADGLKGSTYDHKNRKSMVAELTEIDEKASGIISEKEDEEQKRLEAQKKEADEKRVQAEQKRQQDEQAKKDEAKAKKLKSKEVK